MCMTLLSNFCTLITICQELLKNFEITVTGPNSIAKTTLEQKEGRYIVSYVPVEVGVFTLVVTWNGKDIPGA